MPVVTSDEVTQICSHQKDNYYINSLRGLLHNNIKNLFGNNTLLAWNKEINHLADVVYYSLTTAGSLQTLGEEYTNLIQVESSLKAVPSLRQRVVLVLLHTIVPYCLEKILSYLEKKLLLNQVTFLSKQNQARLIAMLPRIKLILITIHRLHLSIFYIKGIYFTIAKRFVDIQYVKYVANPEPLSSTFSLLGKVSLIQSMLMLCLQLRSLFNDYKLSSTSQYSVSTQRSSYVAESDIDIERRKCSLCLEIRQFTSLTSCGHLYCWTCIQEWIRTKAECPLCREELQPNKIVCLKNYD